MDSPKTYELENTKECELDLYMLGLERFLDPNHVLFLDRHKDVKNLKKYKMCKSMTIAFSPLPYIYIILRTRDRTAKELIPSSPSEKCSLLPHKTSCSINHSYGL